MKVSLVNPTTLEIRDKNRQTGQPTKSMTCMESIFVKTKDNGTIFIKIRLMSNPCEYAISLSLFLIAIYYMYYIISGTDDGRKSGQW